MRFAPQGLNTQGYHLKTTTSLPAVVFACYTPEDSSPKYFVWLRSRPFLCDLGRSGVSAERDDNLVQGETKARKSVRMIHKQNVGSCGVMGIKVSNTSENNKKRVWNKIGVSIQDLY